jgi:hypothetical protein
MLGGGASSRYAAAAGLHVLFGLFGWHAAQVAAFGENRLCA